MRILSVSIAALALLAASPALAQQKPDPAKVDAAVKASLKTFPAPPFIGAIEPIAEPSLTAGKTKPSPHSEPGHASHRSRLSRACARGFIPQAIGLCRAGGHHAAVARQHLVAARPPMTAPSGAARARPLPLGRHVGHRQSSPGTGQSNRRRTRADHGRIT